ncbi:protocatechuate dioxygenase [Planomonospora venezuelensis]|uniref:Protocatechuate 3,4-dioxygenase beta subunit n=1 Tax=Planomonospora venezuelensis TaxID=1999 RepID=A0A841DBR5_PLAVE|nr:protocatechuate dioxygenase [Planomonospora venezuelensis]MBB5965545.1 protocatechuate 3,4-dioxygenase beta subunit [Planomonospora venezuelensis]GIN03026.1 protocatechuate dioxygenase [Planomonospora venezuelensis]
MGHDHEGQRVSRRTALAGIGTIGLGAILAACGGEAGTPSTVTTSTGSTASITPTTGAASGLADLFAGANTCVLTESTTQGPYYFDADKIRSDIREDREGVPLRVAIKVQDSETCRPLSDAVVEIWHCDAGGVYSGAEALSSGQGGPGEGGPGQGTPPSGGPSGGPGRGTPPPGGPGEGGGDMGDLTPVDDKRYLRGAQVTGTDGIVQFVTVWPGWYRGRTVHIHAMVHVGEARVLTTQVMFDEALNGKVFEAQPYARRTGRDTFNDGDTIYEPSMLMKVSEEGEGYVGAIVFSADSDQDKA